MVALNYESRPLSFNLYSELDNLFNGGSSNFYLLVKLSYQWFETSQAFYYIVWILLEYFFKLKTPDFQKRSLYSNSTKRQILQFWVAFISSNLLVKILFSFFVLFAKVFQTAFQLWRWLRWKGCCLHRLIDKKNTKTGKQTETEAQNCQKNSSTFLISLSLENSNNRVPRDFIQFPK